MRTKCGDGRMNQNLGVAARISRKLPTHFTQMAHPGKWPVTGGERGYLIPSMITSFLVVGA